MNKDLEENARFFCQELREIHKVVYKENSLNGDVIFPEEIYNVLRHNVKNEKEFLHKYIINQLRIYFSFKNILDIIRNPWLVETSN